MCDDIGVLDSRYGPWQSYYWNVIPFLLSIKLTRSSDGVKKGSPGIFHWGNVLFKN